MQSSIMDKMSEYKFLMFENDKNNCWLDASVSLIAYNSTIRKFVCGFPESIIYKIISIHDTAMSILNDSTNTDIEDRLKQTRRKLLEIQNRTMRYLQQFLKYKFGEPDSAHCALLNLILKDQSNIKEHLNTSWLWKKVCDNCNKKTKSSICTKPIITLSNVKTFHPECPTSMYVCSCKTEQEMTLIYKELPPCLIFHFEKGAGDGENFPLNFKITDREYQLTGVIIMERSNDPFINHFITLIRDIKTNMWLDCNDLNTNIVSFSSKQPEWNLKDVYICMYESFDNLGKVINELSADEDHVIENLDVELIDLSDEDDEKSVSENPNNKEEPPENELPENENASRYTILKHISENIVAAIENTKENNGNKGATLENTKQNYANEDVTKNNFSFIEEKVKKFVDSTEQVTSKDKKEVIENNIIDYRNVPVSNLRFVPKNQSKTTLSDFKYNYLIDESLKNETKRENNKPGGLGDINAKFVKPLKTNESTDNVQNKVIATKKKEIKTAKSEIVGSEMKKSESSKLSNEQNISSLPSDDDSISQMSQKPKLTADTTNKSKIAQETNLQKHIKRETSKSHSPSRFDSDLHKDKIKKMSLISENSIKDTEKVNILKPSESSKQTKTGMVVEGTLKSSTSFILNHIRELFGSDSEHSQDDDGDPCDTFTESSHRKTSRESPIKKTSRESPIRKISRESPIRKTSRESPIKKTSRESPIRKISRESPIRKTSRELPIRKISRESPFEKTSRKSLVEKMSRESPVEKMNRESLVEKTNKEALAEKKKKESPVEKMIRESPDEKTNREWPVGTASNEKSPGPQACDEDQEMKEEENDLESRMKKVLLKRSGNTHVASAKKRKILEKKQLTNSDETSNVEVRKMSVLKSPIQMENSKVPTSPKRKEKSKMQKSPKRMEKVKMPKSPKRLEQMTSSKSPERIDKSEHAGGRNKRSKENGHKDKKSKRIKEELISHNAKNEKNRFIRGNKSDWEQRVELLVDSVVDKTFAAFLDSLFSYQ